MHNSETVCQILSFSQAKRNRKNRSIHVTLAKEMWCKGRIIPSLVYSARLDRQDDFLK